ncbi:hypothetical protein [Actinacidiphila sp. bgisy167]|uniref:hypothetical protein n=1 Tax=Actinacidiphila sp. bgisy167 TaxID=3413797 RepID=UPI003D724E04
MFSSRHSFWLKRGRLWAVALIAACAVTLATGSEAFASEPGEGSSWTPEIANHTPIQSRDTYSEARSDSGRLVGIYRGEFDDHVWISVDNETPTSIGYGANTSQTTTAPRVIYSNGWFYAFHTGTDGNIYWSRVASGFAAIGASWSAWAPITGQRTYQSVSLATTASGLLMVYRGASDTRMWASWLPVGSVNWAPAQYMGFQSNSAPTVTFNPYWQAFYAVFRGLNDDRVYYAEQYLGQNWWTSAYQLPSIQTNSSPVIASDQAGNLLVTARDYSGHLWLQSRGYLGDWAGWQAENTGWQTNVSPFLSVYRGVIYLLLTGMDAGTIYWKPGYRG